MEAATTQEEATKIKPTIKTNVERGPLDALKAAIVGDDPAWEMTKERAEQLVDMPAFKGERELSDPHVQELYDEMAKGRFRPEHVCIAVVYIGEDTKQLYRINGQHTAYARTFMPKNFPCKVRHLVYRVPDQEELRKLYAVFDPAYSARSKGHLTKVLLVDTAASEGVWASAITRLAAGFRFWYWDGREEQRRQGHNEIAAAINGNAALFRQAAKFLQSNWKQYHVTHRMGAIAAVFECWDRKPTLAADFWKPVCDGLGLDDKHDPRYALREWLMSHAVEAGDRRGSYKKKTTSEEVYRICIQAWNRWRAGETAQIFRSTARRVRAV